MPLDWPASDYLLVNLLGPRTPASNRTFPKQTGPSGSFARRCLPKGQRLEFSFVSRTTYADYTSDPGVGRVKPVVVGS
jgi:hypothetical protein